MKKIEYKKSELPPFFLKGRGQYVHRVRSGYGLVEKRRTFMKRYKFWCGSDGILSKDQGYAISETKETDVRCAICEGKCIGAGMDGTFKMNGHFTRFHPRK